MFFGLSVLWIGIAWVWLPDFAALAGLLPAMLIMPVMAMRKRVVESRLGHVRWSEARRRRERGNTVWLAVTGVVMFGSVLAVVMAPSAGSVDNFVAGLPAFLLALIALVLAVARGTWRGAAYAAVLTAAAVVTVVRGADPGVDMLVSGMVISVIALLELARFLTRYPGRRV